jgi:hypothetical protein
MHRNRFIFGVSALFLAAGIVVAAQQGHGSGPKTTHTTTTPKANAAKPTVAKPATPKAAPTSHATSVKPQAAAGQSKVKTQPKPATMASGGKSQTTAGKPETAASKAPAKSPAPTAAKTTTKTAKNDSKTVKSDKATDPKLAKTEKKSEKPSKTATQTTAKSGTTSTPTTTQLTPVQQKLKQNTNLAAKLESRLPKGTNLMTAAEGFRNLGQFVAAVNVSNNLGISFDELKTKMVTNNMSLGQAIQATRPLTASPTIEAQRAEYDARGMIADSEQTEASAAPKAHGPVTTPTSSPTPAPTATSSTVKTKVKATKTSAQ